jgi:hypothetical protein
LWCQKENREEKSANEQSDAKKKKKASLMKPSLPTIKGKKTSPSY